MVLKCRNKQNKLSRGRLLTVRCQGRPFIKHRSSSGRHERLLAHIESSRKNGLKSKGHLKAFLKTGEANCG